MGASPPNPPEAPPSQMSSGNAKQAANPPAAMNLPTKSDEAPKLGKAEESKKQQDQILQYM